jgi:multiple sugar transport system substrate-binding protein
MKSLVRLMGTMAFALGMAGAAFAAQVELKFLNWSSTEEIYKPIFKVIEDFEKANPDIKIKNMPIGVGEIRNQFMVMTLGGNAPDVVQLHIGDAVTMLTMGAIIPAEELYPKAFIDQLNPVFFKEALWGDKHAGVVWGPNTMTFFVNRKLLKQLGFSAPPKTLDEMEAMMKKGKETIPDLVGFQLDTTIRTIGFTHQWAFINAFEYEPIKGTKVAFNTPGMVQYGEWIRRMIKSGYTLPGKRFGEFRPLAAQGRVLFAYDSGHRGMMKAFNKTLTDADYDATWEVAPLPMGPTGKHLAAPDDHSLAVSKSTKNKEAAVKFVQFLASSRSSLTQYIDKGGFLPPIKDYKTVAPGMFEDAYRQGSLKYAVPNVVDLPFGPNYVKVGTLVTTAVQEIITTDKPVKGILDTYQLKLEGAMQ